ncbi:MAG TPA: GAF domain-containing protein [Microthrixaceae bacterium]|nr:GAF domain-containing protein [Microthrixaceae bacterium]
MDAEGFAGPSQLRRLLDAVLLVGSDLDLETTLHRITDAAVRLSGARYGALGVLDETRTRLVEFVTVGIDDETRARIGDLPSGHGILGTLIADPRPLRLPDLREHPDSYGFPPQHPPMTSFLGVPILVSGQAYGNLYLCDKNGTEAFSDIDQELVVTLAAAAGVAIDNARLHARVRDLAMLEDRERIARDLHDTVIQRLFAVGMSLQGAVRLTTEPTLLSRIELAVDELDATVREIRSVIFELHEIRLPGISLRQSVLAATAECARVLGFEPTVRFAGPVDTMVDDDLADDLLAVVREALTNVAKHSQAGSVVVSISGDDAVLTLTVEDDGLGPPIEMIGGRGIANMEARARHRGGTSVLEPGEPRGTRLRWSVPAR